MDYPKSIYKNYEVVEKDICGEKHYALVRVYKLFGFKYKIYLKVYHGVHSSWISNYSGYTWHNKRYIIESAISSAHRDAENNFRWKMTK